jgi:uncharacterized protein (TIGR03086 family)
VDGIDALRAANRGFERRLRLVRDDDWQAPTPCTEWDVRALVNHVIGANRRYTMLLHGASAMEVKATRAANHIGADAVGSFITTAQETENAFRDPGALERIIVHPIGERTGRELLSMRVLDVGVHSWDLARAIGADEDLDPEVVDFVLAVAMSTEMTSGGGSFAAPTGDVPDDSSAQTRLLHRVGRHPMSMKGLP